jgi:RNA polymerase sigma factor (sigma-70 family)
MTKKRDQGDQEGSLLAFDQYMRYVRGVAKLSRAEQLHLLAEVEGGKCERAKACPDRHVLEEASVARDRLVDEYQTLVIGIARRFERQCHSMELMDLIQEGTIGLLRALEHHDHSEDERFAGLATIYVSAAITEALYYRDDMVRLSDYMHRVLLQLQRAEQHLGASLGREPTITEVAQAMQINEERVRQLRVVRQQEQVASLQALLPDHDASDEVQFVPLFESAVASDGARREYLEQAIQQAIEQVLGPNERQVIGLRYGLQDASHSQSEVAQDLGFGARSVQRIEARAKGRLSQVLAPLGVPARAKEEMVS